MVVLTLVLQNNGETIFLDQAIPQVHFMKLISCSLYNSWLNLKTAASLSVVETNKDAKVSKLFSGHYNIETLAKKMEEALKKINYEIRADAYSPLGQIEMINLGNLPVAFDEDVADLLVIGERGLKAGGKLIIRQMKQPAYFVHCDLIDRDFNFVNNKKSDLLAKIDLKGRPYEKVRYDSSASQPIRDCLTSSHVNSITVSVRDVNGELFDFKGMPLEFELELN